MEKIKVAFFAETLQENYDGAVRTMYQIINRIPSDKFEFLFVCGVPPKQRLEHQLTTMSSFTIPFNSNYKMVVPFLSNYRTTMELEAFQPDVIHIATPSPMGHFALRYAKKRTIPVISIYHTHFLSYIDYYLKNTPFLIEPTKNRIALQSKSFYDNCDLVYVPTTEMIDYLKAFNHETNHYKIWQRGIDKKLFHPNKSDQVYIKRIVQNERPNILFASRLVWEKNLETLIDFYELNELKGSPYNLLIAGDGVAKEDMMQRMPKAHLLGELDHPTLAMVYASADIFLFTSITETYGNVVVEAMASGLPCVIANGGGSKSFIEQGQNGLLCSPNHARDYFIKIELLLNNPSLYLQFIKRGLAYTKSLDWNVLTDVYFEDLQRLVEKTRMAAA